MKKCFIIVGGLRVGDTFHSIPLLNKLVSDGFSEIEWHSGTYEQEAIKLLSKFYPIKYKFYDDGFPLNLDCRKKFLDKVLPLIDTTGFDKVITDYCCTFDMNPNKDFFSILPIEKCSFSLDPIDKEPYVVVQNDSKSVGKKINVMDGIRFPCKVYSLGLPGEAIMSGTIDFRGQPIEKVFNLLYNSKMLLSIHSAMACLGSYIPTCKAVVWHFMDNGLLKFSDFRNDWADIYTADFNKVQELVNSRFK